GKMLRKSTLILKLASTGLLSLGCAASQTPHQAEPQQKIAGTLSRTGLIDAAQKAEKSGEWASALAFYQRAEDQGYSAAGRAHILLITGRYQELIDEFVAARDPELVYLSAQALRRVGQVEH